MSMVIWPDDITPRGASAQLVDNGAVVRSPGGAGMRINRLGGHFRVMLDFPPAPTADAGRRAVAALVSGVRRGLRIAYPLVDAPQGVPGSPVVDGANPVGYSLPVRGLTPHYAGRAGYWLSVVDAEGQSYLHNVAAPFVADASGDATISVEPALRAPLSDGAAVELRVPVVEGFVEEGAWDTAVERLISFSVTIEEAS